MREREESNSSTVVVAAEFLQWDEVLFGLMNQHSSYRPKVHWSGRVSVERSDSKHAFSELFKLADKLIEFITSTGQTVLASGDASGRVVAWAGQVCGPKRTDQESSRCEINVFALIRAALRSSFVRHIHGNNWRPALQDDFDEMIKQLEWFPDYWCGAVHSSLTEFEPSETTNPPDDMRVKRKIIPARSEKRTPPFCCGADHWIHDAVKRFLYAMPEGEFDRDNRFDRNFKQPIGRAWFQLVNACRSGKDDTFLLFQQKELVAQLREWFGASSVRQRDSDPAVVAAKTLREQPATNANEWPLNDEWDLREGEAAFRRVAFPIQGVPWRLLKELAEKTGAPVSEGTLMEAMNGHDGNAGEDSLRSQLTRTRDILRASFRMSRSLDPLPNVERGRNAAWKLDEKVFPSVSEIQRWLNGR